MPLNPLVQTIVPALGQYGGAVSGLSANIQDSVDKNLGLPPSYDLPQGFQEGSQAPQYMGLRGQQIIPNYDQQGNITTNDGLMYHKNNDGTLSYTGQSLTKNLENTALGSTVGDAADLGLLGGNQLINNGMKFNPKNFKGLKGLGTGYLANLGETALEVPLENSVGYNPNNRQSYASQVYGGEQNSPISDVSKNWKVPSVVPFVGGAPLQIPGFGGLKELGNNVATGFAQAGIPGAAVGVGATLAHGAADIGAGLSQVQNATGDESDYTPETAAADVGLNSLGYGTARQIMNANMHPDQAASGQIATQQGTFNPNVHVQHLHDMLLKMSPDQRNNFNAQMSNIGRNEGPQSRTDRDAFIEQNYNQVMNQGSSNLNNPAPQQQFKSLPTLGTNLPKSNTPVPQQQFKSSPTLPKPNALPVNSVTTQFAPEQPRVKTLMGTSVKSTAKPINIGNEQYQQMDDGKGNMIITNNNNAQESPEQLQTLHDRVMAENVQRYNNSRPGITLNQPLAQNAYSNLNSPAPSPQQAHQNLTQRKNQLTPPKSPMMGNTFHNLHQGTGRKAI